MTIYTISQCTVADGAAFWEDPNWVPPAQPAERSQGFATPEGDRSRNGRLVGYALWTLPDSYTISYQYGQ